MPVEAVRAQVRRVLESRTFEHAPVLRRLLEHLVDRTLAGKADELKEYALGVDVFDRGSAFDPRVDTIVRVQARRLRSKLDEYYTSANGGDPVVIELPRGHYIPLFRMADGPAAAEPAHRSAGADVHEAFGRRRLRWIGLALLPIAGTILVLLVGRNGPRPTASAQVAVAIFENRTGDPGLDSLAPMIAERLIRVVAALPGLVVVPHPIDARPSRPIEQAAAGGTGPPPVLVTGAYFAQGDRLEFQARFVGADSGRLLHAIEPILESRFNLTGALAELEQKVGGAAAIHFDKFFGGLELVSAPPTLDGYREYRAGLEIFHSDYARAVAHLERAHDKEPGFLLPLLVLFFAHANLQQYDRVEVVQRQMQDGWDRLTAAERLIVEFARTDWNGRRAETLRVLEDLERLAPASLFVNHNIVQHAVLLNRPGEAAAAFARLPGDDRNMRHSVGTYRLDFHLQALHLLGHYDRELAESGRAQLYEPTAQSFLLGEIRALIALGRVDEVAAVVNRSVTIGATSTGGISTPGQVMVLAARELRVHGYAEASRRLASRAVDWYLGRAPGSDGGRLPGFGLASALYATQRWEEARQAFAGLAAGQPDTVLSTGFLGRIAAREGDRNSARAWSARLRAVQGPWLRRAEAVFARACIAAALGDREEAVELLRDALGQGFPYGMHLHDNPDLMLLRGYAPFDELMRPTG